MAVDLGQLTERYVAAQLTANRREALRLLFEEGYHRGASVPDLLLDVIRPAQHRVGALWEENRIGVADEHAATAISELALAQLSQLTPGAGRQGPAVVVACVPGEQHDLGARIVADLLDAEGFDVAFLGASVPIESLIEFVRRTRPALTALSVTMVYHLETLRDCVHALRGAMGGAYPLLAGGDAVGRQPWLVADLGLAAAAPDCRTLAAAVRRILQC